MIRQHTTVVVTVACLFLAGCGGGGSQKPSDLAPGATTTPAVSPSTPLATSPGATPTPGGALSARAAASPDCPATLAFDTGDAAPVAQTAADGRTLKNYRLAFEATPWMRSTELDFNQPYADGDRLAWIERVRAPQTPGSLKTLVCSSVSEPTVLATKAYADGQVDIPTVSGDDIFWEEWSSRGANLGSWSVQRFNAGNGQTTTLFGTPEFLGDDGTSGHQPLAPVTQVEGGRYIADVKTDEPEVTNILVGTIGNNEHHLITNFTRADPPIDAGIDQDISGTKAVYMARDRTKGDWTWDIWLYDFTTDTSTRLTDAIGGGVFYNTPHIDGDHVAYVQSIPEGNGSDSVWLADLATGTRLALMPVSSGSGRPALLGLGSKWIVWESLLTLHFARIDDPNTLYEVAMPDPALQLEVHGNNITWVSITNDRDTGRILASNIYWFRLPD